jgi:hypothetical protein
VLPKWAGVVVAAHAPLISGPFSVVGSLLAVVGGGWIALSVLLALLPIYICRSGAAREVSELPRMYLARSHGEQGTSE